MKKRFTGLFDMKGHRIYEGDIIMVGMRQGDHRGWTAEKVVSKPKKLWKFWEKKEWVLVNPNRPKDGFMQMQNDPLLRKKIWPE